MQLASGTLAQWTQPSRDTNACAGIICRLNSLLVMIHKTSVAILSSMAPMLRILGVMWTQLLRMARKKRTTRCAPWIHAVSVCPLSWLLHCLSVWLFDFKWFHWSVFRCYNVDFSFIIQSLRVSFPNCSLCFTFISVQNSESESDILHTSRYANVLCTHLYFDLSLTLTLMRAHACTDTCMPTYLSDWTYTCMSLHAHMQLHSHIHACMRALICAHIEKKKKTSWSSHINVCKVKVM